MKNKKAYGFTLAEVLITLGVIGVVAALTIPQLVQDYREKASVAQLKKTYSILEQAWRRISADYGNVNDWGLSSGDEDILIDRISPYFNTIKVCHSQELEECIPNVMYLSSIDTNYANWIALAATGTKRAAMKLSDGSVIMLQLRFPNEVASDGMALQMYVDLNGEAKPNKLGDDFFYFFSARNGDLYPGGHLALSEDKDLRFKNACLKAGHACANWVLENENKDYLKCKDLSYYGKRKCK